MQPLPCRRTRGVPEAVAVAAAAARRRLGPAAQRRGLADVNAAAALRRVTGQPGGRVEQVRHGARYCCAQSPAAHHQQPCKRARHSNLALDGLGVPIKSAWPPPPAGRPCWPCGRTLLQLSQLA